MPQKLYQNVIPIDRAQHQDFRIEPVRDFRFSACLQSVPLVSQEFYEASKEYPIVFVSENEQGGVPHLPVALLGLVQGANLFVEENGNWDARYIPAFLRRYPFMFVPSGKDQITFCVDADYAGFNAEHGEVLFNADAPSPALKQAMDFASVYQQQIAQTLQLMAQLREYDLLIQQSLKAELPSGQAYQVQGFWVIDEEKLQKLDPLRVQGMFSSGQLALIYAHLMSISNLGRLVDRMAKQVSGVLH